MLLKKLDEMRCRRAGGAGLLLDRLAGWLGVGGWLDDMAGLGLVHVGVNIGWCLVERCRGATDRRTQRGYKRGDGHTNKKMSAPP